jgi:SAM-dependent methyltransferase
MNSARQPHAPQDLQSRKKKGLKIERLLNLKDRKAPIRLLEIGTGSGGISNYFGTHPELECIVDSVDINDIRLVKDGYTFFLVESTTLPFNDQMYDVVISNHVIEHVGEDKAQLHHLQEIYRVLREDGIGYIALPNRWMLVEPHYQLAFLSWLPRRLRTPYLKFRNCGEFYDCEPLEMNQLETLLRKAELNGKNLCPDAIVETFLIEKPDSHTTTLLQKIPRHFLAIFNRAIPTLIYSFKREKK